MEATVFKVHLIVTGGVDVVRIHLEETQAVTPDLGEQSVGSTSVTVVVTHQVDSVSLVCIGQLPRKKRLPLLSVLCWELCITHTHTLC